ncbi:hypothetical protein HMPREF0765_4006 [Sphingobacterium spiritivorum ATCC 33300]|uniref:DUF2071 domain-containing protein n=1 Tax=Sphingobacterium spiritivorum ATCC 33300 TaxID=525372 RepID=C2G350_SPHSI|nr:DUF2071 domain-containing protein [Sphingobacterium spiritivorum]EEI90419.1 hypothetical protein HMPREF0765_4006 [Sphingobacterium spiritivorum ATCC 33300]QQS95288.1 DUF2071 domain-containing protein [Sphingobacterium spiritivorum]
MNAIQQLLTDIGHRPWNMPASKWQYYQEWNDALFLHFEIDYTHLRKLVPAHLHIDSFDGKYYISLVAFKMQNIRPRNLPAVGFISDFYEINVRTYIDNDQKKGVYFIHIEAEKALSAFVARTLSGLPYEKSGIARKTDQYTNDNIKKNFNLHSDFSILDKVSEKSQLDLWLTERYCLYLERKSQLWRYDIHHKEWEIHNVHMNNLLVDYNFGGIKLSPSTMIKVHYSPGVKVVSWKAEKL